MRTDLTNAEETLKVLEANDGLGAVENHLEFITAAAR